jgi:hypothetical protein
MHVSILERYARVAARAVGLRACVVYRTYIFVWFKYTTKRSIE